jgi:hypothetical protein
MADRKDNLSELLSNKCFYVDPDGCEFTDDAWKWGSCFKFLDSADMRYRGGKCRIIVMLPFSK